MPVKKILGRALNGRMRFLNRPSSVLSSVDLYKTEDVWDSSEYFAIVRDNYQERAEKTHACAGYLTHPPFFFHRNFASLQLIFLDKIYGLRS
jgi:hypothetical protein